MQIRRMQDICERLEAKGSVDIKMLSAVHKVTEKTIRQDLTKMEEMGLLERVRGGAVLKQAYNSIFPIKDRRKLHTVEKTDIARAAYSYINDGDIIILDNGTTTLELAKLIKNKRIIVIANDLVIVNELYLSNAISLYVTGGRLKNEGNYSFVGADAIKMIQQYHANKVFLGTSSISMQQGLMTFSSEEADVKRAMIEAAEQAICLADSTKFNRAAFVKFTDVKDLDMIITDKGIAPEDVTAFAQQGVDVIIA